MHSLLLAIALIPAAGHAGSGFVHIPAGEFRSVLKYEDVTGPVKVPAFALMRTPVSNADFLAFVRKHPEWQRGRAAPVFVEADHYLSHWQSPLVPGPNAAPQQPVTRISWFAATAYCESLNARLPTWNEWEYVAAADRTRRDARSDPAWREELLRWYAEPSSGTLPPVGRQAANAYGIQDMHGLVWEWTQDYAAMLVSGDNRTQSDPDKAKFCGAGALAIEDKEDFAVMMRVAMLSSLEAVNSTSNLGFRCARSIP
ncbi:formylglycine-generating enzyme family protein [Arenimonas sp. GDDSR-1]|uniref:formylglycine-generating enzyme family protein n=1 Tax=Arenimonas sp. GDDSR-1 TaxID=2950125 RepID=UPI00260B513C|nr:formylglycine-generating enzyme family protein [Arenimonas sp. GDDSR-1]